MSKPNDPHNPTAEAPEAPLNTPTEETEPIELELETTDEAPADPQPETKAQPLSAEEENWKLQYARLAAEFDNFRKRTLREKEMMIRVGNEQLILALIPTLDDLDRALKAAETSDNLEKLREGVQLVYKKFTGALERQGITSVPALGEAFNAEVHEAIASMPVEDPEKKGKVIDELERGYTYHGKLIRVAKVVTGEA